jgi:FkbM family methyltransferase
MLVFDIGMHNGDDTAHYLARGCSVVAVEASLDLCRKAEERFADAVASKSLTIVNCAFWKRSGDTLDFYFSSVSDEFSSLDAWRAAGEGQTRSAKVKTINLDSLVQRFGAPRYIKCDIEGADQEFVRQLLYLEPAQRPPFVSVEGISVDWLGALSMAGYDRFQLVNQAKVRRGMWPQLSYKVNDEPRVWTFGGHSSGPCGFDLPIDKWRPLHETTSRWTRFADLQIADPDMTLDIWFDFHATTSAELDRLSKK